MRQFGPSVTSPVRRVADSRRVKPGVAGGGADPQGSRNLDPGDEALCILECQIYKLVLTMKPTCDISLPVVLLLP